MIRKDNYSTFQILKPFKNLIACVSLKNLGNMSYDRGAESEVNTNRKKFFKSLGILPSSIVMMDIVHGNRIKILGERDKGLGSLRNEDEIKKTDGFISDTPGIFLMTTVCDCLPALFYDKKKRIVGLAHVGFKGTKKKLVSRMIKKFVQNFESRKRDILVAFGPCIKSCCIDKQKNDIDLVGENIKQLAGLAKENIEISKICTMCDLNFFSHRRDEGFRSPAHGVIIGMRHER